MTAASDEEIKATAEAFLGTPATEIARELMRGDAARELPAEHFQILNEAIGWLSHFAEMDCECSMRADDGKIVNRSHPEDADYNCATCAAQQAIERILRVVEPPIETLHPERTRGASMAERIYLDTWRQENQRQPWRNHGNTTIEAILNPDLQKMPPRVSPRDGKLIATFVQWLGTNCGRAFIEKCERRIEEDRADIRKLDRFAADAKEPHHAEIIESAKAIAAQWVGDLHFFGRAELQRQIVGLVMRYYGGRKSSETTTAGQRYFDTRNL